MSQVEEVFSPERAAVAAPPKERRSLRLSLPWPLLVGVAILAAHLPLLIIHGQHLLDRVQYGYFPLVPLGAYFLAQQRLRSAGQLAPGNFLVFSLFLGWSFLLSAFSVAVFSPVCGAASFLFVLLACAYGYGGWKCVSRVLPAWLFMWFIIPLPFQLDQQLILSLQSVTARWSSRLLDAMGVLHMLSGNTVEIPGHKLLVEEACSGVRSLFVILAFTTFFVLYFRQSAIRAVLLLAGSVLFVLIANVLRVVLITLLTRKGFSVTEGWPHELLGIGVFLFAMGTVLSFDRLLMFLLPPRTSRYKGRNEAAREAEAGLQWPNWQSTWLANWPSLPAMALYGLLAGAQLYLLWPSQSEAQVAAAAAADSGLGKLTVGQMPTSWEGWSRMGFFTKSRPHFEASTSRYWAYRSGTDKLVMSIDYPFGDWHNLLDCYRATGWTVADPDLHGSNENPSAPYFAVAMNRSNLQHGYLLYFLFDSHGRPLEPRLYSVAEKFLRQVKSIPETWRTAGKNLMDGESENYYQFQVFLESFTPLSEDELKQARDFYRMSCEKLRTQWLPDVAPAAGSDEPSP